jgi:Txe/YoeB family toxin of Txe-Axe toxin-antitoxin module
MPEELDVSIRKWQQTDSATLERFYDLIQETPLLHPEKLGPYEPFEYDFEDMTAESLARMVIEERGILTQRNRFPEQGIYYRNISGAKKPNVFGHSMEKVEEGSGEARTFIDYAFELFKLFEPVYGRVCCMEDYRTKNLVQGAAAENAVGNDLRKHLPGIYWVNFFGPRYVDFFGEDRLLTAPAHESRWLGEAGILLLVSESPFDYDDPEVKATEQAVVERLGPEAFFFKSDPEDKEYRAPDLSDLPQFAP